MTLVSAGITTDLIDAGLVARWNFEGEGDTTTATDSVGGHDGTINGATYTTAAAVDDHALSFDGVDDNVDTSWAGVTGSQNRTIALWLQCSTDADQILVYSGNADANGEKAVFRTDEVAAGGAWAPRLEVVGGFIRGSTALTDGAYHHVAFVLDGSDVTDVTLYVDGGAETVDDSAAQAINTTATTDGEYVRLAMRNTDAGGTGDRALAGELDDVRFYDRALSAAELSRIAAGNG
jgi:hypothetical protein